MTVHDKPLQELAGDDFMIITSAADGRDRKTIYSFDKSIYERIGRAKQIDMLGNLRVDDRPATHLPKHPSQRFCSAVLQFCTSGGNRVLSGCPYSQ